MKSRFLVIIGTACVLVCLFGVSRVLNDRSEFDHPEGESAKNRTKSPEVSPAGLNGIALSVVDHVRSGAKGGEAEINQKLNASFDVLLDVSMKILSSTLSPDVKYEGLNLVFDNLARQDVGQALKLLSVLIERFPLQREVWPSRSVIIDACARKPNALVDWVVKHPGYIEGERDRVLFYEDVVLAISEFDLDVALEAGEKFKLPRVVYIASVAGGVKSFSDRSRVMDRVRILMADELDSGADESQILRIKNRILVAIGKGIAGESIEGVGGWMASQGLTADEKCKILESAQPPAKESDRENWYSWVEINLGNAYRSKLENGWSARLRYK